jgi:pyridoxal phosphate enzyme (YggS family)
MGRVTTVCQQEPKTDCWAVNAITDGYSSVFSAEIMCPIESNLQHVRREIDAAIAGLPEAIRRPVTLVAVSKTRPAADIREAFRAGQRAFGENYAQEGVGKMGELGDLRSEGAQWHFIGPLQSNKATQVARHFDWVHGLDRLKIAEALSRNRLANPINVCIQVNASGEASKGGLAPQQVLEFATALARLPGLRIRGLMTIIENTDDPALQRVQFRLVRAHFEELQRNGFAVDTLSMGMSQDFRQAIDEGATMVRIGSAIFGART